MSGECRGLGTLILPSHAAKLGFRTMPLLSKLGSSKYNTTMNI